MRRREAFAAGDRTPVRRRVVRPGGELAVEDFPGAEPTVVLMHGFPDRRSINAPLAQALRGRRVLLFDFLGYGESDKPEGFVYDAASREDDLEAVVSTLTDGRVVIVGHDASGPTAINWARRNPDRTEHLVLLNCYYHPTPSIRFPELIALFADPATRPLTTDLAADERLLLTGLLWQGAAFARGEAAQRALTPPDRPSESAESSWPTRFPVRAIARFIGLSPRKFRIGLRLLRKMLEWKFVATVEQLGWIEQLADRPSTTQAFLAWTGNLDVDMESNRAHVDSLKGFERPVTVAFGRHDPYIGPSAAREIAELFPRSAVILLDAGHWVQLERPDELAALLDTNSNASAHHDHQRDRRA